MPDSTPYSIATTKPAEFLFLGVNTPWVYALAVALAEKQHGTRVIATYDWLNFRRHRPNWPAGEPPTKLQREWWIQPPGYVGVFATLFTRFLRRKLARSTAHLQPNTDGDAVKPWVVAVYPWFMRIVRAVPSSRLIYYKLDDYTLYHPKRARLIEKQEEELIRRAALTICLSKHQQQHLQARFPEQANVIQHLPLGVVEAYLNLAVERPPKERLVNYVGNLVDRVDWAFVAEVARRLPDVQFRFVGALEGYAGGGAQPDWESTRAVALALPNVHWVRPVPQEQVPSFYWDASLNWIPYTVNHSFNQAACPTKVMDGLAGGRQMLSTDLQECRLYPEWIQIAASATEAAETIRRLLVTPRSDEQAHAQVAFARENTWTKRACTLLAWLKVAPK